MTPAIKEKSRQTDEIALAYTEAWNAHDLEKIVSMFHPTCTFKTPASETALTGAAIRSYLESMLEAMPDITVENVGEGVSSGNLLAGEVVVSGTWTKPFSMGPLAGLNPTGKSARFMTANFLKVHDGKIIECAQYYDRMTLVRQLAGC
jgi:steroid delta-isomerase-like uncharacterized protein